MKLTELNPRWINLAQWSKLSPPFYVGVSFDCPHCKPQACPTCGHCEPIKRLAVMFWPPIDPAKLLGTMFVLAHNGGHERTGDTFETLTLSPGIGFEEIGHWRGQLTNGEISSIV
jgi:hypothetical protein